MPMFDHYVMIDWSGGGRRRGNKADAIWIAQGAQLAECPTVISPYSRTEASEITRRILEEALNNHQRVLVCFDFAYGYPANFSAALRDVTGIVGPPWSNLWRHLHNSLKDDEGTEPNHKPTNRSNRFEVVNQINSLMSTCAKAGPFWCTPRSGLYVHIPQNRPTQPFETTQGYFVRTLRLTDERARSDTPFRLFGTGSVGSQVLTGIPRLQRLRTDPALAPVSIVWPFETGWADSEIWLGDDIRILHAEIYPSVRRPRPDLIKDRGQVWAMWEWARDLDRQSLLWPEFSLPAGIEAESAEDIIIRSEEGWILGTPKPHLGLPVVT